MALFETALLAVCRKIEEAGLGKLMAEKGNGLERIHSFLKRVGIDSMSVKYSKQLAAATKFRNCLIHANDLNSLMRKPGAIRQVLSRKDYLLPNLRGPALEEGYLVRLRATELGEQLDLGHLYVHLNATVLRETFLDICDLSNDRIEQAGR